jgi:raffinose/stachyose/melibiose transport system permease protein
MTRPGWAVRSGLGNALASGAAVVIFAPIFLVFVNALKTRPEASSMSIELPTAPQWQNFSTVIESGKLDTAFVNSVLYAFAATALCVTASALAAYVLARNPTRRNRLIYLLLILGIAMPTNFVTLTSVMQATHLINTQLGIILLYAATQIPFSVFLIYAFMSRLPPELEEAAFIDGASPLRAFRSVVFPQLTPVLVTCAVLNILNLWNEFLLPLYYLNRSSAWPMTLAVYNFFGQYLSDWSLVSADVVLTIVPVILVYLVAQRWIQSGVSAGAVKG